MHTKCEEVFENGRLIMRIETRPYGAHPIFVRAVGPNADCIDDQSILVTNDVCVYGRSRDEAFDGVLERLAARAHEFPEQPGLFCNEQTEAA